LKFIFALIAGLADRQRRFLLKAQLAAIAISALALAAFFLFTSCASAPPVEAPDPVAERLGDLYKQGTAHELATHTLGTWGGSLNGHLLASSVSGPLIRKIDPSTRIMAIDLGCFPKSIMAAYDFEALLYFVPSPHTYTPDQHELLAADYKAAQAFLSKEFEELQWEEWPGGDTWVFKRWRLKAYLKCFNTRNVQHYLDPVSYRGVYKAENSDYVIGLIVCIDDSSANPFYRDLRDKEKDEWHDIVLYGDDIVTAEHVSEIGMGAWLDELDTKYGWITEELLANE